jgi:tetratricopeptide (TPR) repeat protein
MLTDRYGNELATSSTETRDLYVDAVDKLLGAAPDTREAFNAVTASDPDFALGHSSLARACQIKGDPTAAKAAMATARSLTEGLSAKDAAHINALGLLIDGNGAAAYPAIRQHVAEHPRDVLVAQTCTSVFGLIGFSGRPGREAELLAYTTSLAPHYGDDWWFLSQHAFSFCETGQLDRADEMIDRALAVNPRNAHGAHVRAHVYYEAGEPAAGMSFLEGWLPDYDQAGLMHSHLSWHLALWKLGQGDIDGVWSLVDQYIRPSASQAFPLIVLTDYAAILYRAELAGVPVPAERWKVVSDYAHKHFPNFGVAFADVHAALAYAMTGETDALARIIANPAGPAGDVVKEAATAFQAIANQDWSGAADHLAAAMADHARIGGSRAQRDLLDHSMLAVMLKLGRSDEARRLLALRRPVQSASPPVAGMAVA